MALAPRARRTVCTLPTLLLVTAAGCSPRYYVPNTHNVPLLDGEGALAGTAAVGDGRVELQGAYAVRDHLGLMLNAAFYRPTEDEDGDGGEGGIAEVGAGWLRPVSDRVRFEVFGLLGGGDLENHFPSTLGANPGTTGLIEGRVLRFGIQPTLGFRSRYVQVAASTRLARLRYSDVRGSLVFAGEDQAAYLRAADAHTLVEPALTLRFGLEEVKLQLQLGRSFNLTDSDFRQDRGHLTVGIVYAPLRAAPRGR